MLAILVSSCCLLSLHAEESSRAAVHDNKQAHLQDFLKTNPEYTLNGAALKLPKNNKVERASVDFHGSSSKKKISTPMLEQYKARYNVGRSDPEFKKEDDMFRKYFDKSILDRDDPQRALKEAQNAQRVAKLSADHEKASAAAARHMRDTIAAEKQKISEARPHVPKTKAIAAAEETFNAKLKLAQENKAKAVVDAHKKEEHQKLSQTISQERARLGLKPSKIVDVPATGTKLLGNKKH